MSKLCLQYVEPIIKNRIYNYIPAGLNLFVGPQARPSEITYSDDRLRPDYQAPPPPEPLPAEQPAPAQAPTVVDPSLGLQGLMVPQGAGS